MTQRPRFADDFDLGPVDQVSFVVGDMEQALPAYEALFGEFDVNVVTLNGDEIEYRGTPADATIAVALGRSGDLQIELIQPVAGESPFAEHVRAHGDGVHHVRFVSDDVATKTDELVAAGFQILLEGRRRTGVHWVYLEAPEIFGYSVFELIQFPESADA
jgi:methylmalonyl-CoA/ethylmalonyl-CoA epimerase